MAFIQLNASESKIFSCGEFQVFKGLHFTNGCFFMWTDILTLKHWKEVHIKPSADTHSVPESDGVRRDRTSVCVGGKEDSGDFSESFILVFILWQFLKTHKNLSVIRCRWESARIICRFSAASSLFSSTFWHPLLPQWEIFQRSVRNWFVRDGGEVYNSERFSGSNSSHDGRTRPGKSLPQWEHTCCKRHAISSKQLHRKSLQWDSWNVEEQHREPLHLLETWWIQEHPSHNGP